MYVDMSRVDNVQGTLGAIGPFWAKWGLGRVPQSPSFFCVVIQRTFRQLRNGRFSPHLVTKCSSVSRRGIREDIFENFHIRGYFPPKFDIENRSNRHFTQSRLQVMECTTERYCLLHVVVQRPVSLRRTVAELWGVKVAQFSDLDYFSHTKPLKRIFR